LCDDGANPGLEHFHDDWKYPPWRRKLVHSSGVKQSTRLPRAFHNAPTVRSGLARSNAFSFAKAGSIGFRSGLYGGMDIRLAPAPSIASRTPATLCERRLSRMTTSPGRSVGTRTCST